MAVVLPVSAGGQFKSHGSQADYRPLSPDEITMNGNSLNMITDASDEIPVVISEVPEGTLLTYHRTGGYIYDKFMETGITEFEDDMNVVFAEDGKVYIQNPITTLTNGNWVEGTYNQETGIISIPTGQCVSWMANYGYGGLLVWGHTWYEQIGWDYDYDEPVYWLYGAYDPDVTEIRYKVEGNTITLLDGQGDVWAPYPEWGNTAGPCLIYSDNHEWGNVL